jgi:hypothetical protein
MIRALLWKEWRRLRALRWTLIGIGLALPGAFALAAKAAEKGWGMEAFTGYSMKNILLEAVPATLGLGLWPLAAMVLTVQAFTAERADGTESFLLDRPVSRAWVWMSRLVVSIGSLGTVVLVGLGMLLAFSAGFGGSGFSRGMLAYTAIGCAILMLAAILAALGATSLLSAHLAAFLLALLLAATPLLAGAGGAMIFPYANWGGVPLAGLAACLLGLAMPLASFAADTRGEPGGRGRQLRSALSLGGGLALSVLGFAVGAPVLVRAAAPRSSLSIVAPQAGGATLVMGSRFSVSNAKNATARVSAALANGPAGYLIDLATGRERAFLRPELQPAGWDARGTKLAVLDSSGPLGSVGAARLRFLDGDGRDLAPAIAEPDGIAFQQGAWAGERFAIVYGDLQKQAVRVDLLDLASGTQTNLLESARSFATLHAAQDGRLFVHTVEMPAARRGPAAKADWASAAWSLRPLDVAQSRVGPVVLQGRGGAFGGELSPSGRYWARRGRQTCDITEIASGATRSFAHSGHMPPAWMRDDSLVWIEWGEKGWKLFRLPLGEEPQVWTSGPERFPLIEVSPDGAFVAVKLAGPDTRQDQAALLLEAGASGPARSLGALAPFRVGEIAWAGPHTLAATRGGRLALYDVLTGKSTVVFGRP